MHENENEITAVKFLLEILFSRVYVRYGSDCEMKRKVVNNFVFAEKYIGSWGTQVSFTKRGYREIKLNSTLNPESSIFCNYLCCHSSFSCIISASLT